MAEEYQDIVCPRPAILPQGSDNGGDGAQSRTGPGVQGQDADLVEGTSRQEQRNGGGRGVRRTRGGKTVMNHLQRDRFRDWGIGHCEAGAGATAV